jgi:hypothetical protein
VRSRQAKRFALATILLAIGGSALFAWQQKPPAGAAPPAPAVAGLSLANSAGEVRFSHPAHGGAQCVDCHHPLGGNALYQACKDCHRAGAGTLDAQAALHQTCIGCHKRLLKAGKRAPSHRCSACHRKS